MKYLRENKVKKPLSIALLLCLYVTVLVYLSKYLF